MAAQPRRIADLTKASQRSDAIAAWLEERGHAELAQQVAEHFADGGGG